MKKIYLILFPFLFVIMSIGIFFANKEFLDILEKKRDDERYKFAC